MRKPVFGVSDVVRHKPGFAVTEDGQMLEILYRGRLRKWRNCTSYAAKTKALISFVVTAKLICVFVFAYAKDQFSHGEAHMPTKESRSLRFWISYGN